MRELGLFEQYLLQLRQEKLQQGHQQALAAQALEDLLHVRTSAAEAELVSRVLVALRALSNDPGLFIKEHLK